MCSQCISSIKFINIHTVLFYIGDWYLYIFKIDMVILFVVSFPLSNSSLTHRINWVSVSKKFWWHVLDTWYHPHPMIRVFTQSPDMIADMIWIHLITLSNQCLQNLFTQGHDMKCCLRRRGDFHWLKPFSQSIFRHFYYLHAIAPPGTSTKIGDEMKTYDRGFLKALLWLGFPQRFLVHILRGGHSVPRMAESGKNS